MSYDDAAVLNDYMRTNSLSPDQVVPLTSRLKLGPTPTLLLVDHNAIVQSVWIGKLANEKAESEVLARIQ